MSAEIVATRLRQFLLGLAALLCLGTLGELSLLEHLEEPLQVVPFVLCGMGLVALAAVFIRPHRKSIWSLRIVMVLVALGGFLGIYEHLAGNWEFALEINQQASGSGLLLSTLTGASPALAPGILIITAIVAQAATYFHPALRE
jgi:hypothetical protein